MGSAPPLGCFLRLLNDYLLYLLIVAFTVIHACAQNPSQSKLVAAVPSWFSHCAGENGSCVASGPVQVIFGAATGTTPTNNGGFFVQTVTGTIPCSNSTFGDPSPGQAKACWYGPVPGLSPGKVVSTGGSDYPFYVQNFESWDDNQRVVVGLYHLNPTLVTAQLQQMYAAGERAIALVIWYMPFDTSTSPVNGIPATWPDVWGAYVNSSGGHLSPQAQQNLTAILGLLKQIGFQQVTVRFGPIGSLASPTQWGNNWQESLFQQDETFEFSTRQLVESVLAGSSVQRTYDLGIELAGIPHNLNADERTYSDGQSSEWTSRMWADYIKAFGPSDSYGFSIAYSFGTLGAAIAEYDQAGVRPSSYGIDLYTASDLWNYYQELTAAGDNTKPLVIQEISYNDTSQMQDVLTQLAHYPLTILYIDQWPVSTSTANADASPPTNYGAYGGTLTTTGTLIVPPCTLSAGQSTCTTQASWATSNASQVALYVNGVQTSNLPNITTTLTGTSTVTLGLTPATISLVSGQATIATQSTPGITSYPALLSSKAVSAIDPAAPVVTLAGLGGANEQFIWAIGSNIASTCSVELFDPGSTTSVAVSTITNVSCQTSSLSFQIPLSIATVYSAVNVVVSNSGHLSQAYYLPLQIVPTLSVAGRGGPNNESVWAIGTNISSGCAVKIYSTSASASTLLWTIRDASCQSDTLSFPLPATIRSNYSDVFLTTVNANGQESNPVKLTLN